MGQSERDQTALDQYRQAVQIELEKFERKENEFLRSDREERAARLAVMAKDGNSIFSR